MKTPQLILTALLIIPCLSLSDIVLTEGETYSFSFTLEELQYQYDTPPNLPLTDPPPEDIRNVMWGFQQWYDEPHVLLVELYETSISSIPFLSRSFAVTSFEIPPFPIPAPYEIHTYRDEGHPYSDFLGNASGMISFTSLSGNSRIDDITIGAINDDKYYAVSIPEPNSVILVLLGTGALWMRKRTHLRKGVRKGVRGRRRCQSYYFIILARYF